MDTKTHMSRAEFLRALALPNSPKTAADLVRAGITPVARVGRADVYTREQLERYRAATARHEAPSIAAILSA
jgi:hypothetical protein